MRLRRPNVWHATCEGLTRDVQVILHCRNEREGDELVAWLAKNLPESFLDHG